MKLDRVSTPEPRCGTGDAVEPPFAVPVDDIRQAHAMLGARGETQNNPEQER